MKKALALLLAVIMTVSLFAYPVAAATTIDLTLKKTAEWTNAAKTEADIIVNADIKINDPNNKKVLIVGTLCNGHGMGDSTLIDTINNIAKKADVTYYAIYASQQSSTTVTSESIKKGNTVTKSLNLDKPRHYALKEFITILDDELVDKKNTYDYILFEFDSARVAIDKDNRGVGGSDPGKTFDALSTEMNAIADILSSYYNNQKVLWVTDIKEATDTETYSFAKTAPNNRFDQGSLSNMGYLTKKEFKALASVFAPDDYKVFDTTFSTYEKDTRYTLKDINDYDTTDAISYKTDYTKLDVLTKFVNDLILEQTYEMEFSDTVDLEKGLEIISAKLETYSDVSKKWVEYTNVTPTIDYDTGKVTAKVTGITNENPKLRMVIHVKDTGIFKTSSQSDINYKDPNKGSAEATVVYPSATDAKKTATTEVPLKWTNDYSVITTVKGGTTSTPATYLEKGENAVSKTTPTNADDKLISVKLNGTKLTGTDLEKYIKYKTLTFTNVQKNYTVDVIYGKYIVSYEYEGDLIPDGAQNILDTQDQYQETGYPDNTKVTVAANPSVSGYSFSGWDTTDATVSGNSFTMPGNNVILKGSWSITPDLAISADVRQGSVSVNGETIPAGSTVTYVAKVTNNHVANETATDVVVTMEVPESLTDIVPANGGTYDEATRTVTWTVPKLEAGSANSQELTFTAKIPDDLKLKTTYTTDAEITSAYGSPYSKTSNEVNVSAETYIGKTVKKTWSDTWAAHTSKTVRVRLFDGDGNTVGAPFTLSNTERQKTITGLKKYDTSGNVISYTFKELDNDGDTIKNGNLNGKYKVRYSYDTPSDTYIIFNDYDFDENDITIKKIVSSQIAKPGDEVIYTITVKSTKDYESATNVKVKDVIPKGLTVTSTAPAAGTTCSKNASGAYIWNIPSLAPNTPIELKITAKVSDDANNIRYENTASAISIDGKDINKPSETVHTDVKTYTAKKVWLNEKGNDESNLHTSDAVTLSIYRDGVYYGTVAVGSSTGWTYTWTNLPLFTSATDTALSVYSVKENNVPTGFTVSYSQDENGRAIVTNKRIPVTVNYVFTGEKPVRANELLPKSETFGYGHKYNSSNIDLITQSNIVKGYTFTGWYNEEECNTLYTDGTAITTDTTLYGKFTRNRINVSFEYKGNVPGAVTTPSDITLYQYDTYNPSEPTSPGFEFKGWYKNPECTEKWDPTEELPNDVTVYGLWEAVPSFDISADVLKEDVSVDKKTVPAGSDLTYETYLTNTNIGGATLYDVVVRMSVPDGLKNIEPEDGGTYNKTWNTITWTIPVLDPNDGVTLKFNADVPDNITEIETYTSQARVTSVHDTPYTGEDGKSNILNTKAMPLVSKTVIKEWSDTWECHTNTDITVGLFANEVQKGTAITLNYAKRTVTVNDLPKFTEDGALISYTFKELSGAAVLSEGSLTGKYKVSYSTLSDTVTIKNSYQFDESDFTIEKSVSDDLAAPNDTILYTVTLTNIKPCESATDITVSDIIPTGLSVTHVIPSFKTSYSKNTDGTYVWNVPVISPEKPAVLKIYAKVLEDQNNVRYSNTAKITKIEGRAADKDSNTVLTDVKTFKVTKVWLNENGISEAGRHYEESLKLSLYRDGVLYSEKDLTSGINWTYTWEELPLYKDGSDTEKSVYEVRENTVPEGFNLSYEDVGNDSAKVINKRKKVNINYVFLGDEKPYDVLTLLPASDSIGYAEKYTSSPISAITESPVIKGYTFSGWYNEEVCNTKFVDGTSLYTDTTLYGKFTRNKVNVSFEYKGNVPAGETPPSEVTINQYDTIDPSNPNSPGYEFKGWYNDPECTLPWDPTEEVEKDTKIYGLWDAVPDAKITADVKKDGVSVNGKTVNAGSKLTYENKVTNVNVGNAPLYNVLVSMAVPEGLTNIVPQNGGVYDEDARKITWTIPVLNPGDLAAQTFKFKADVPSDLTEIAVYTSQAKIESVNTVPYTKSNGVSNTLVTKAMPLIEVTVTKAWSDTWENHLADTVNVKLYADGKAVGDMFTLSFSERSRTIKGLPKYTDYGELISYYFRETDKAGNEIKEKTKVGKYIVNYKDGSNEYNKLIFNEYEVAPDDLSIKKSVSDALASPGMTFDYTITVTNSRLYETAKNIKVSDVIPKGLTVMSTDNPYVSKDDVTGTYMWTIPSIGPNSSEKVTFKVFVPYSADEIRYENSAKITDVNGTSCNIESNTVTTDVKTFTLKKIWLDETGEDESSNHWNDSLSISLLRDGSVYDKVNVTKDDNWTYTWEKLPLYIDGTEIESVYTIAENDCPKGFEYSCSYYDNSVATMVNRRSAVKVTYHFVDDDLPDSVMKLLPEGGTYGYGFNYHSSSVRAIEEHSIANGYEFSGWYTDKNCKYEYDNGTALYEDLDLYGCFEPIDIDVTYNEYTNNNPQNTTKGMVYSRNLTVIPNGGTYNGTTSDTVYCNVTEKMKVKDPVPPSGKDFLGWSYYEDSKGNVTLTAHYSEEEDNPETGDNISALIITISLSVVSLSLAYVSSMRKRKYGC